MSTNRRASTPGDSAYPIAPAPWTLKGDMFWMIIALKTPLPANIYDSLTAGSLDGRSSDFRGGIGMIQIIRYDDSPVGPYSELCILPGNFTVPGGETKGKKKLRISRIYVDSETSCYNGRRNWNIPKHLARFEWSTSQSGERRVAVFESNTSDESNTAPPFFSATLTPVSWLPGFPLSTRYLPLDTTLVQPPFPAGGEKYLPGTESWKSCDLVVSTKRAKLIWAKVDSSHLQSDHWPQVKSWSLGVSLDKADFTIEKPDEFHV